MKRLFALLLAASFLFGAPFALAACSRSGEAPAPPAEKPQENPKEPGENPEDPEPHAAHLFGEWKVIKEATCQEEGVCERVCSCGARENRPAPKTSHAFEDSVCLSCGREASRGLEYAPDPSQTGYIVVGIGECADADLAIPDLHEGKSVTAIGESAFSFCNELTDVALPNGLTAIGRRSFANCVNLTSVNLIYGQ